MNKKTLYILWAVLFILCAGLGFIPQPEGAVSVLLTVLSVVFFVPPAWLLYDAARTADKAAAALIRNLLGLGSLLAFPGSMLGALTCGLVYAKTKHVLGTLIGEVFGTAILGGLCAYPIAILFMGQSAAGLAFYAYIIPFLISTAGGAMISAVVIYSLKKSGVLQTMQASLER